MLGEEKDQCRERPKAAEKREDGTVGSVAAGALDHPICAQDLGILHVYVPVCVCVNVCTLTCKHQY